MAVNQEVLTKISDYEKQGYSPDEIVAGLAQSQNYRDVAAKVGFYKQKGYTSDEILGGIRASAPQPEEHPLSGVTPEARMKAMNPDMPNTPEWAGRHPNLYGAAGAARETLGTTLEGGALIAGGMAGTPLGPAGQVAGAGLGYAGAKRLVRGADTALGNVPAETLPESLANTGKDVVSGAVMEAGGQIVGAGLSAATQGIKKLIPKLYASATKMSTTLSPKERAARVATGLKEGITPNDKGLTKLEGLKKEIFNQIDDAIKSGVEKGDTISTQTVLKRLKDVKTKFSESATPNQFRDAIDKISEDFKTYGDKIPVDKAQRIKQNIYQILKDTAYGELKGPQKETQKAIARGIKEELEGLYPELKGLNKKASEYIKLQDSLERAIGRIQNRDVIGLGDEVMATAGAVLGGPVGAGAVVTRKILGLPNVKARIAIALYKAGKEPTIKGITEFLKTGGASFLLSKEQAILKSNIPDQDKERFLTKIYEGLKKTKGK